nr:hypothetical protein GCM10020092_054900 [Actinoplanes digitatis]
MLPGRDVRSSESCGAGGCAGCRWLSGLAAALGAAAELSAVEHPSLLTVLLWSGVGVALLTVALAGHLLDRQGGDAEAGEPGERAAGVRGFVDGRTVDGRVSGVIAEVVPPGGIDGVVSVGDVGAGGDVAGVRLGRGADDGERRDRS